MAALGILLHRAGQPYSKGLFTVHKLSAVILVYLIIKIAAPGVSFSEMDPLAKITIVLSSLSMLGIIASGGAMSLNRNHALMLSIHTVSTVVFLLSISYFFYSILK